MDQDERLEFRLFCQNASDAQLKEIRTKELKAGRQICAAIALSELERRFGLDSQAQHTAETNRLIEAACEAEEAFDIDELEAFAEEQEKREALESEFKPSQLVVCDPVPFVDTFGRVERECAAAIMVMAMRERDDTWEVIYPRDCAEPLKKFVEEKGYAWISNPFYRPDFPELISEGFVEEVGDPVEGKGQGLRFTSEGLAAMKKWVR